MSQSQNVKFLLWIEYFDTDKKTCYNLKPLWIITMFLALFCMLKCCGITKYELMS